MNPDMNYFKQQGRMSDPGSQMSLFNDLPTSIPELVKLVQGVTIHVFWTERYGFKAPPERMAELQLRSMEKRLARTLELDPRPLTEPHAGNHDHARADVAARRPAPAHRQPDAGRAPGKLARPRQIGRASCRERV